MGNFEGIRLIRSTEGENFKILIIRKSATVVNFEKTVENAIIITKYSNAEWQLKNILEG